MMAVNLKIIMLIRIYEEEYAYESHSNFSGLRFDQCFGGKSEESYSQQDKRNDNNFQHDVCKVSILKRNNLNG